jgi:predicted ATPase
VPVKGVREQQRVHRLVGVGGSRSRFDVARSQGLSRFVGRTADLRTLEDALQQSRAGTGQVVGVVAEAGTGKSRLCFAFLEHCRTQGVAVYEARAVAPGGNVPFLPILELFRSHLGVGPQDDAGEARRRIEASVLALNERLADTLSPVCEFLGVADPAHPAAEVSPEDRQRRLLGVMHQLMWRAGG